MIKVDTRIKIEIKISNNKLDIFICNKQKQEIILIEIIITSKHNLQQIELRRYNILANGHDMF